MTETIQTAMDRLMTISVEPQDYVAEDGLLYCGSCNTPKEAFFPNGRKLFGRDRHPAECQCRQATREKQEKEARARLHYEKVQRLKLQGFTDWAMQHWTFENDHGQNPQMHLAQRYVDYWPEMRGKNVGLLLWGGVGTGKSFMAGCIANDLMLLDVFADKRCTGTNFDRPEFERLLKALQERKIDCIVVKDFSRLGRNFVETGQYLEQVFPLFGVRFIAINDNYDSLNRQSRDGMLVPIKSMINEMYSKDLSQKSGL